MSNVIKSTHISADKKKFLNNGRYISKRFKVYKKSKKITIFINGNNKS